ncbi:DNA-directed RNA polymerase sigma-70 factor [Nitrospira sp. KM1]|uniref:sigma-70 family RNA polymerase sigma factor n=1 Tax=Nitrospira sp. KM1 TaxID=1936990 RepID=UPI0013A79710|nr:sigma-70 family RNA polymerase sigma factor [Nitrospira sp. KM1]BCA56562.1 DNA-directed RNA polymerase sigma-70 factor [Nitrospira sp. KM1]
MSTHDYSEHPLLASFLNCYDELTRFLTRKLGCKELAADIVQDTYLRVTRVDHDTDVTHPRAFLFRTAANLATDAMRRQQLRSVYEAGDVATEAIASQAPSAETVLEAQQQCRLLQEAVATLPPKCRTVFLLHKAQHLSYGEVAAQLNISKSAVEKHMSKALAHCRDYMERGGR